MEDIFSKSYLSDENLSTLSHHEHWEIIFVGILVLHVFEDGGESVLVLLVYDRPRAVSGQINSVHLIKNFFNFLLRIKI